MKTYKEWLSESGEYDNYPDAPYANPQHIQDDPPA